MLSILKMCGTCLLMASALFRPYVVMESCRSYLDKLCITFSYKAAKWPVVDFLVCSSLFFFLDAPNFGGRPFGEPENATNVLESSQTFSCGPLA